jgi:eukaryotic-like serine/threonine-protein kinase
MEGVCSHCSHVLQYSGEPPRFCGYCGHPLTPADTVAHPLVGHTQEYSPQGQAPLAAAELAAQIPETVGGYRILKLLGSGGMGAVYEAEEPVQKKRVALKLISAQYTHSPETIRRFRREGLLASSLVHPRCVFVLGADEEAGRPYIVMELMPGRTLQDLVREGGPLRSAEAIVKILDVMEGLEEAHNLGVVHRDVKPSNCFLEETGRVKIGDFGLSKSLAYDGNLTRTGAFMGTPQYAAPEQIKAELVDSQSDVYSVAATLYFLLVGRAPFQEADPVATMAAIVSEAPPSLRTLQARLSTKLDRVVLKGLERDRKKRWQSLDEFRQALVALLPSEPSIAGLGLRFSAYLFDLLVLAIAVYLPCLYLLKNEWINLLAVSVLDILYYGFTEGIWGQSLGKRLFGLRVVRKETLQGPGLPRAIWRAAIVEACWAVGSISSDIWQTLGIDETVADWLGFLGFGPLVLVLLVTMRRRNGYRGIHEFLSGTATAALVGRRRRRLVRPRGADLQPPLISTDQFPEKVGSFQVTGAVRWDDQEQVLLAEDPSLGRKVWIWRRPLEAPLPEARHQLNRATRPRWLQAVEMDGALWECFVAPAGTPLPQIRAGAPALDWEATRPLLEELVEELTAGRADATLPATLAPRQIWVQPTGRVLVIDIPYVQEAPVGKDGDVDLAMLREAAKLLMASPAPDKPGKHEFALPMPTHARRIMNRLAGESETRKSGKLVAEPFHSLEEARQALLDTHDLPIEVGRGLRGQQLALMTALTHVTSMAPLGWYFASLNYLRTKWLERHGQAISEGLLERTLGYMFVVLALWCIWSFLLRGGLSYRLVGIHLRRTDGRKAARWQCALRVLLVWGPVVAILSSSLLLQNFVPAAAKVA